MAPRAFGGRPFPVAPIARGRATLACEEEGMKDIDALFGKAIEEIARLLSTKSVVGEPISVDGRTLIPLVSVGFGFGVGAGEGNDPKKGAGGGGGTGGGGGVKPVAVVIVEKEGVRVEPIKGAAASLVDKVADVASKLAASKSSG